MNEPFWSSSDSWVGVFFYRGSIYYSEDYPQIFRDQGGGVRYLEIFQTDYDSLKTPVGSLVWALRIKYRRLMPAHYKALSSSIFSPVTTSRHTGLTGPLEPVWKLAA